MTILMIPTRVSAAADRPASYSNQLISSTRPSCWIQISMVDVINIAADHQMFMTLTGELSWQRLRQSAVDFYSKNEKIALWATLSGLIGYERTLSIAHWKARGRLNIRHNWMFFAISYGWDVMSGNQSRRFSKEGGSLLVQISQGRGHRPPTTVGVRKLEWLTFRVVSKYLQSIIQFCHNTRCHLTDRQTDGWTDGWPGRQNFDSNTVRCIKCSFMVKTDDVCVQYHEIDKKCLIVQYSSTQ